MQEEELAREAILEILGSCVRDKGFADSLIRRLCIIMPDTVLYWLSALEGAEVKIVDVGPVTMAVHVITGRVVRSERDSPEDDNKCS